LDFHSRQRWRGCLHPLLGLRLIGTTPASTAGVVGAPPTSHPTSFRISPLRFIPSVRTDLNRPLDETSPVSSPTFTASHTPYTGEFLTAVSGSTPLLLPSPCVDRFGSLLFPFRGQHVGAASFTLCYGLLLCFPFSGSYNASAQSVTQLHRLPARCAWLPDLYQNWTRFATSEQTMIYQDAPTLCWLAFYCCRLYRLKHYFFFNSGNLSNSTSSCPLFILIGIGSLPVM